MASNILTMALKIFYSLAPAHFLKIFYFYPQKICHSVTLTLTFCTPQNLLCINLQKISSKQNTPKHYSTSFRTKYLSSSHLFVKSLPWFPKTIIYTFITILHYKTTLHLSIDVSEYIFITNYLTKTTVSLPFVCLGLYPKTDI